MGMVRMVRPLPAFPLTARGKHVWPHVALWLGELARAYMYGSAELGALIRTLDKATDSGHRLDPHLMCRFASP